MTRKRVKSPRDNAKHVKACRDRWVAQGLCRQCGKEPLVTTSIGAICREKRKQYGKPPVRFCKCGCGQEVTGTGKSFLPACAQRTLRERTKNSQQSLYRRRKDAGLCTRCGSDDRQQERKELCRKCAQRAAKEMAGWLHRTGRVQATGRRSRCARCKKLGHREMTCLRKIKEM